MAGLGGADAEHRLLSFISQGWRGKPLLSHEAIINLIAATTLENRPGD